MAGARSMSVREASQFEEVGDVDLGGVDPAELVHAAEEVAREHPHGALAGCFAVGFVLGGGLTPRLLASALLFVGRRYAAEVARGALGSAVRSAAGESGVPAASPGAPERRAARS
jgi:hypothetical protein